MEEFANYLLDVLNSFDNNPPYSQFQEGYLEAIKDISKAFLEMTDEEEFEDNE